MLGIGLPGQVDGADHLDAREAARCVKIEGGDEADRLREVDRRRRERDRDRRVRVRRQREVAPFGTPSEKGRVGTVHLALGDNHNAYPGGQNVSVLHLDGVFLDATMQIVDDGTLDPQRRRVGAVSAAQSRAWRGRRTSSADRRCRAAAGAGCCSPTSTRRGQRVLARLLGLHAGHGHRRRSATRPRRSPTCVSGTRRAALDGRGRSRSRPARRSSSRPASGTPSPTPATRTS